MKSNTPTLELVQFAWSPFCLVQRRILEYGGIHFKLTDIPPSDRSLVWKLTRQRYYQVPVLRDGRLVIFETGPESQVVAKYLESKFNLGLFPPQWDGIQQVLWLHIEDVVEGLTFRLNDAYFREFVPAKEQLDYLRWKERKFGRGCVDEWRDQQRSLVAQLVKALQPYERMLMRRPFLLENQPRFVDFDLWGMLANFLFSGHYRFPAALPCLRRWYAQMEKIKFSSFAT
ncbi:MAG TPA: glutathione S-transferase C-terminal domain-containing protein [Bacillota bacterium]|nr:glutathione S-transferase C-terminal domain-containing protein [Bacillota bacterium]